MSIQEIRLFGDPVLTTPASPVTTFDKELRNLVKDLTETMLDAPGAGLAAPQIGVSLQVFVWNIEEKYPQNQICFEKLIFSKIVLEKCLFYCFPKFHKNSLKLNEITKNRKI